MSIIDALTRALGEAAVLTGERIQDRFRSDASTTGTSLPKAVIRPSSVEETSTALRICNNHRQTVTPQGGMTGLAGGANPRAEDVALSLERFFGIEEIDTAAATMIVRAGTPLAAAQEAAAAAGFLLPIDLNARGSCQIGGIVATNAGGLRVIRHGATRDNVLGLEAVLADGTIISSLNKMKKNNTGFDLRQIFIGSEGALGIITRAVLRLHPLPAGRSTALCALADYERVVLFLRRAQAALPGLSAFEAMWESYFQVNQQATNGRFFRQAPAFAVILEEDFVGERSDRAGLEAFLAGALGEGLIKDAVIAQSEREGQAIWKIREGPGLNRPLISFDVSIAIGRMGAFADDCAAALAARFPDHPAYFFGHVGDSNLHIVVLIEGAGGEAKRAIDEIVYGLVQSYAGSISAEHGVGVLKRDFLHCSRTAEELAMMRRIKAALDPNNILNPGKVLPEEARYGAA
jgi:FAD/FMN-containing dehydrogenase